MEVVNAQNQDFKDIPSSVVSITVNRLKTPYRQGTALSTPSANFMDSNTIFRYDLNLSIIPTCPVSACAVSSEC